jgi:hypothetical protein
MALRPSPEESSFRASNSYRYIAPDIVAAFKVKLQAIEWRLLEELQQ